MGHFDRLTVADAGLPIPSGTRRIDLALTRNIPSFLDTLRCIADELCIQKIILAQEIIEANPGVYEAVRSILGEIPCKFVPHEQFKAMIGQSRAVVRTGEFSAYANIILESGVVF